ncbi:hypothetical protein HK098_006164 [Nowakowskiella sp. JEL0407]|nr:hypothetical protein HK098_006164 [Nowakowskiella sp. JEL0407]
MALLDTYDAIWAFASTVDRVINLKNKTSADFVTANGISSADITLKQWVDTNYQGVTGNLRIDTKTGTRISKMTLMQYTGMFWNVSSYDPSAVWKLAQVGNVTAAGKISMSSASSSPEPFIANYNLKNLIWPGNRTTPPLDHVVYTDELVYGSSAGIGMAIILIIWSALDHDGVYKYSDRIRFTNIILCNNPDMNQAQVAMTATIISYNGVLTLLTALLAYLTRNVPSSFREAKLLGFATYNTVIIGLFLVLQQYIMNQTVGIVNQFLVRRILILISGIFTYGCTVGINLYLVMIAKVQSGGENDLGTKTLKKAQKDAVSSPPSFLGQTDNTANNPSSGKYSNVSTQKSGNGNENQVGMTSTIFSNSPISQTTMSMKNESKLIDSWRQVNVWWIPGSVAQIAISSLDASVSHVIPINQIKEITVVDYNGVDDKDTIVVQWGQQKLLLQCDTAELAADWGNTIKEHQNMLQSKA